MSYSIIVAMDKKGLIGSDKHIPWRLSSDLKHLKATTMGSPVIMGRKTHESIGRPLPGRENIVITRDPDYKSAGCTVLHSIESAIDYCKEDEDVFIMGGAEIYKQSLPRVERIYLTEVHAVLEGDTWFPELDLSQWSEISRVDKSADDNNEFDYSFVILERI